MNAFLLQLLQQDPDSFSLDAVVSSSEGLPNQIAKRPLRSFGGGFVKLFFFEEIVYDFNE